MQESKPRNIILFHDVVCSVVLIVQRTWYVIVCVKEGAAL